MTGTQRIVEEHRIPGHVLPDLARWTAEESAAFSAETSPFEARLIDGDARILLVTGANASGKSLAFRLIAQLAESHGIAPITLSIRERTGGGTFEMARMRQTMIYGHEERSSTGAVSARVVQSGFRNMDGRGPTFLGLDEPEMGLSDGYAGALGEYIGQRAAGMGSDACGVMVVTHSRRLAGGMARGLGAAPAMLTMDVGCEDFDQWMSSEEQRTVEDLLGLEELSGTRRKAVQEILGR